MNTEALGDVSSALGFSFPVSNDEVKHGCEYPLQGGPGMLRVTLGQGVHLGRRLVSRAAAKAPPSTPKAGLDSPSAVPTHKHVAE